MGDSYRALRAVATILRVLAWIIAVFGGLTVIATAILVGFDAEDVVGGVGIVVAGLLVVAFQTLMLFAASALITLFIDIERNTRTTAEILASTLRDR